MTVERLNIIALSDLNWDPHLRNLNVQQYTDFSLSDLELPRYERISRYYQLILKEQADLVLFLGDLTGDGFCGHGFQYAFTILLKLLEQKEIPSLYISGNHDPDANYNVVQDLTKSFKFTQEISQQTVQLFGLNFMGINYNCSKSKTQLKKQLKESSGQPDILLAHSQIKRRIRHFDFGAQYIFTGHYDRKLFSHRQTVFTALDNDSEEISYALLQKRKNHSDEISIKIKQNKEVTFSFTENVEALLSGQRNNILDINGQAAFDLLKLENASDQSLSRDGEHYLYLKYLRGINYASSLDTMYRMGQGLPPLLQDLSLNQLNGLPITASYKISEAMIEDYLGDVIH